MPELTGTGEKGASDLNELSGARSTLNWEVKMAGRQGGQKEKWPQDPKKNAGKMVEGGRMNASKKVLVGDAKIRKHLLRGVHRTAWKKTKPKLKTVQVNGKTSSNACGLIGFFDLLRGVRKK